VAATNAALGPTMPVGDEVATTGSFTEPEYAQTGLSEAKARATHEIVTAVVHLDSTTRTIIDGRTFGFCKLIADRKTARILGCHVIGERAVDIAEVAAITIAAGMRVDSWRIFRLPIPPSGDPGQRSGPRGTSTQAESRLAGAPCRKRRGRTLRWKARTASIVSRPTCSRAKSFDPLTKRWP
jgi:Pyridine nucleotide-disulphide oxidoreductase, dimerisation domain